MCTTLNLVAIELYFACVAESQLKLAALSADGASSHRGVPCLAAAATPAAEETQPQQLQTLDLCRTLQLPGP